MKFSKQTIDILKNFSQINSSIMLTKGSFIMTKSINSVVYAEAEIADVIDEDVGIYDLNSFLNMLNIVGTDAEITHDISTGEIVIRGDKMKIIERSADATTIPKPKKRLVKSKESQSTFSVEVGEYEGDNVFNFDMKIDNMQFINSDYKVEISSKGAAKFSSDNGVAYVVVLEASSTFK